MSGKDKRPIAEIRKRQSQMLGHISREDSIEKLVIETKNVLKKVQKTTKNEIHGKFNLIDFSRSDDLGDSPCYI